MAPSDLPLLRENARAAVTANRFTDAKSLCLEILAKEPEDAQAAMLLGVVYARTGEVSRAIEAFERVIRFEPTRWQASDWLCVLHRKTGDAGKAQSYGIEATRNQPNSPDAWVNLGLAQMDLWRLDEALTSFNTALNVAPNHPSASHNRGVVLQRLGRFGEAEEAFSQASRSQSNSPYPYVSLGKLLHEQGRGEEADRYFDQAKRVAVKSPSTLLPLAQALWSDGLIEQARDVLNDLLHISPDSAAACSLMGNVLRDLGRFDEAILLFEKTVALEPNLVKPYFDVTQSKKITDEDRGLIDKMTAILERESLSVDGRRYLRYALGKSFDDLREYDRAFFHYKEANKIMHTQLEGRDFDPKSLATSVDRIVETFTPEFFAANEELGSTSDLPLLIVGMIRSGTTLLEQILSCHPEVGAGGELHFLIQNGAILNASNRVDHKKAQELAKNYLLLLKSLAPGKRFVTDKMPHNFSMLGIVRLLFPQAHVVHCQRSPRDTCLSIYVTPYRDAVNFAHDPNEIAFSYREYLRLMAHWRAVLPASFFHEVKYESIISDMKPVTSKLLEFCGLAWNENCMNYSTKGGAVLTPTNWQVRQPLYRSSVGRYENYRQFLPEFESLPDYGS